MDTATKYLQVLNEGLSSMDLSAVGRGFDLIYETFKSDGTVYIIGNGGSASTASHMACDLGKGASQNPKNRRLRVMSLNDNMAHFSALGNDCGYESVFEEQLKNILRRGDLLVAISASGNSPNLVRAVSFANENGASTVGLLGFDGGALKKMSTVAIHVPVNEYGQAEDVHLIINHIWTEMLKEAFAQA